MSGRYGASLVLAGVLCALAASRAFADELPAGVVYASDADPVQITSISYLPQLLKRGDTVDAEVVCSSNTAAVTAQVGTYRMSLAKTESGIFHARFHLPRIPFYRSRQTVTVTAIRADGATTQQTIAVDIH